MQRSHPPTSFLTSSLTKGSVPGSDFMVSPDSSTRARADQRRCYGSPNDRPGNGPLLFTDGAPSRFPRPSFGAASPNVDDLECCHHFGQMGRRWALCLQRVWLLRGSRPDDCCGVPCAVESCSITRLFFLSERSGAAFCRPEARAFTSRRARPLPVSR
jgi:hypothetical protein